MTVAAFPERPPASLFQEKQYGMQTLVPWLAETVVEEGADED